MPRDRGAADDRDEEVAERRGVVREHELADAEQRAVDEPAAARSNRGARRRATSPAATRGACARSGPSRPGSGGRDRRSARASPRGSGCVANVTASHTTVVTRDRHQQRFGGRVRIARRKDVRREQRRSRRSPEVASAAISLQALTRHQYQRRIITRPDARREVEQILPRVADRSSSTSAPTNASTITSTVAKREAADVVRFARAGANEAAIEIVGEIRCAEVEVRADRRHVRGEEAGHHQAAQRRRADGRSSPARSRAPDRPCRRRR